MTNNTELQRATTQTETFDKKEYQEFIAEIKQRYNSAQIRASIKLNVEVIKFYWDVGKKIIDKQRNSSWGDKILQRISFDMSADNPKLKGFSVRNLEHMRAFALAYPHDEITKQLVSQLPWGHIILLIQKVKDEQQRNWYIEQTISNGWSRDLLSKNIKNDLYARKAIDSDKVSNFSSKLPESQSRLAQDILQSPYNFDFLNLHEKALERDVECSLIQHMTKFMLQLGKGFAFVGNQVPISLEDSEYFIDMLFYHLKMRCYVVIELKAGKFQPEHTGKLNFYLNLLDDFYKSPEDGKTIGLLLCQDRNKVVAEYSLKGINKPIGVSEYDLVKSIPENLKPNLPTVEEIEKELND